MCQKDFFIIFVMIQCLVAQTLAGNKENHPITLKSGNHLLAARPPQDFRVHDIGTLWNTVTNYGGYGDPHSATASMEWPGGSGAYYLWIGGLWIGAVCDEQIRVSHFDYGDIEWMPSEGSVFEFGPSKSNLDSYVIYDDLERKAGHIPLGLQVSQRALTWNAPEFDDFIAYEYEIVNVGMELLTDIYVGWYNDCDVGTGVDNSNPGIDDLVDYDGWHSSMSTGWHGLFPNLTTANGEYIDIVENIDKNFNTILDGYDPYGVPYGDPYNPRYDPAKIHPDGFPDEWQVFVNTNGDTIFIPRGISFMYDGDDPTTEPNDTGELDGAINASGYVGGRLLYSPIAAYQETADDTLPRICSHQWWNWEGDPENDFEKYQYLSGQTPGGKIFQHPLELNLTEFDYRFLNSTGPFAELAPGDTLHIVYASAVGQGLMGLRKTLDNALIAYYSGSEHSDPFHPSNPVADYHWGIAGPPIAKDIQALPAYVKPGQESVTISARVYDIDGIVADVQAKIYFADGTLTETIQLLDDGTHGDPIANDGIYTNTWQVIQENFYTVSLYTRDNDGNEITREKVARFTSSGPVGIKSVSIIPDDPAESPFLDTRFQIELENHGQSLNIENIVVKIKTRDYLVTKALLPLLVPDEALLAGKSYRSETNLVFYVGYDCPNGHVVEFEAEIRSGNYIYWRDAFSVIVVDDKPPYLLDVIGDRYCDAGKTAKISVRLGENSAVKEARADIQSPDDVTIASVNLVNTHDDIFEADWVSSADQQADYDVDIYLSDNFDNVFNAENIACFTTKPFISHSKILLVDNDNYNHPSYSPSKKPYESYYTEALDSIKADYDVYSVYFHGPVDSTLLEFYRDGLVIWETGDTRVRNSEIRSKSALEPAEQAALMNYLDHGGKLLLSGQGVSAASELSTQFFNNYLGVSILSQDIDWQSSLLMPVAGEPLSAGLRLRLLGGTGANNQDRIASLSPMNERTMPIFNYPNQNIPAIKVVSGSATQIIYLAFGFESISLEVQRITLMSRIVESMLITNVEGALADKGIPLVFALHQNYPNPFNPVTTIRYDLPTDTHIKIQVLNLLGQQVEVLVNQKQCAGLYNVNWEATGYSSGVYVIRFVAGDFEQHRKVLLLK